MLDEYYRNGKLFVTEMMVREDKKYFGMDRESILTSLIINDAFIKEHFRKPPSQLLGAFNIGKAQSEKDLLRLLGKYFEVSMKSTEILKASFFNAEEGRCSYCGQTGEVFPNRSYVFPFERKIDSIASEYARLRFCKRCGFILYSGMAYLYKRGQMMFFFDSYDPEALRRMNDYFSTLRDPGQWNRIRKTTIPSYHPHETMFIVLYEFVRHLVEKRLVSEVVETLRQVRLNLYSGSGQLYSYKAYEGNLLEKIVLFFNSLIEESQKLYKERIERTARPSKIAPSDLIFHGFFRNLEVERGRLSENMRLREFVAQSMLKGEMPFEALNEIVMERRKRNQPFPFYYKTFIAYFLEDFELGEEKGSFERINGLGYAIGREIKGTNLESFVWDIFRARGYEDLLSSLAELQLKLKITVDWRSICANEKEWRKAKAILLNGIANAVYGGKKVE